MVWIGDVLGRVLRDAGVSEEIRVRAEREVDRIRDDIMYSRPPSVMSDRVSDRPSTAESAVSEMEVPGELVEGRRGSLLGIPKFVKRKGSAFALAMSGGVSGGGGGNGVSGTGEKLGGRGLVKRASSLILGRAVNRGESASPPIVVVRESGGLSGAGSSAAAVWNGGKHRPKSVLHMS